MQTPGPSLVTNGATLFNTRGKFSNEPQLLNSCHPFTLCFNLYTGTPQTKLGTPTTTVALHHRDTHSLRKLWVATTSAISLHVNSLAKASKHPKLYKHELTDMRNTLHTIRPEWQAPTSAWKWKAQALPPRRWWILSQAAAQCTIFADVNITLTTQHK
jgi:hypothetical protein